MSAREINPFCCPDQDLIPVSQDTMIDEQSQRFDFIECFTTTFLRAHSWLNWVDRAITASGHNYALDRSAIGAGLSSMSHYILLPFIKEHEWCFSPLWVTICFCQNKRTRIRLFSSMSHYILQPFIKEHEYCFSPVWVTICFCQQ